MIFVSLSLVSFACKAPLGTFVLCLPELLHRSNVPGSNRAKRVPVVYPVIDDPRREFGFQVGVQSAKLFEKAQIALKTFTLEERFAMMDFIKEHHTYLSRIRLLLEALHACTGDPKLLEILENAKNEEGFRI